MNDTSTPSTYNVATVEAIKPGTAKCVQAGGKSIALYNVDGTFYATDDTCSHEEASLSDGWLEGKEVTCPLHGAIFDVTTGEAQCLPATKPVNTYFVRQEDGAVYLELLYTRDEVMETLREVNDPELGINLVDLGLIRGIDIKDKILTITYTLTTPACPMNEYINAELIEVVKEKLPKIEVTEPNLTWEPLWNPSMMSEDAKLELGFF